MAPPVLRQLRDGWLRRPGRRLPRPALLKVTGFIPAGGTGSAAVTSGSAVKIMTGAPIPAGGDAVVPVEVTEEDGVVVRILTRSISTSAAAPKTCRRATSSSGGTFLRPPEISMLASLGRLSIAVHRHPRVAIVSTGDELVEPGEAPRNRADRQFSLLPGGRGAGGGR